MIRTVTRCRHCDSLEVEGLTLDAARQEIVWQGQSRHLEPATVKLLSALIEAGGSVLTTDRAIFAIWGHGSWALTAHKALHVYVVRLREALKAIETPVWIRTAGRDGYALERIADYDRPDAQTEQPEEALA